MKVRNIEVGPLIGVAPSFRVYPGKTDDGKSVILKVAKTFEDGDVLMKDASRFTRLNTFEKELAKFEMEQNGSNSHYDWLFAHLESSFLEPTQNDRRINVYTTPEIEIDKLIPLSKLRLDTEIDARTSIWILGRLFKFYSLFELRAASEEATYPKYPSFWIDDFLIAPKEHRLVYYNYSDEYTSFYANEEVKTVSHYIKEWAVCGNDPAEQEYSNLLDDFVKFGRKSFAEAHHELYELVEKHWGFKYHPFTHRDQGTIIWNTIEKGE